MAKKASAGAVNKALIIREALTKGIESPSDISAYAKQNKGLEIDPKYVSVIKSQIRAKERGKVTRGGGRDIQKEASMFALRCGTIDKAKKTLESLKNDPAMAFAIAMGGIDRAINAIDELASHISE